MAPRTAPRTVKTVPLENATDPMTFSTNGKPPVPEELKTAPRADGGMSTGETGGNYAAADSDVGPGTGGQIGLPDPDA